MKKRDLLMRVAGAMIFLLIFFAPGVFAKEYQDTVQGFSIIYPDGWIVEKSEIPDIFFVTDPAKFPWLTAGVSKAVDFTAAVQAHMKGWTSGLVLKPIRETLTQGGTKAFMMEVEYVVRGYDSRGLVLGIQDGGTWAMAAFSTAPPWGQYDEAEFLKVLKTLKFKK
ncbi:MAG: hypothetical protein AB1585_12590 [Thermodesulfobacteriota bacterium]